MAFPSTPMPVVDAVAAVTAVAADVALGEPVSLEVVLSDSTIFLNNSHWFKLLQDDGKEMTPNKIRQYLEPSKGKPKKKYKTISHGGYFYQVLYSLAGDVLASLERKRQEYFPRLPTSQNKYVQYHSHNWKGDCTPLNVVRTCGRPRYWS